MCVIGYLHRGFRLAGTFLVIVSGEPAPLAEEDERRVAERARALLQAWLSTHSRADQPRRVRPPKCQGEEANTMTQDFRVGAALPGSMGRWRCS